MSLPKRYNPRTREPEIMQQWQVNGTYHFESKDGTRPIKSIDTPPPTVSGNLHLGHCYSYTHTDLMARFFRMRGNNIFYPMGYDDNGLPTERLVERMRGIRAQDVGRTAFIEACLEVSEESEKAYEILWQRLGLSVDWRYTYRTIDDRSRRIAQESFLKLVEKGLVYRQKAPTIWCPECQTAIAQADVDDLKRESEFVTLQFQLEDGAALPIATTRPELLPACVAIFVHPEDARYAHLLGKQAQPPLTDRWVTILPDEHADPEKGTGAVMCCTFGDSADVDWWRTHNLDHIDAIAPNGTMTAATGEFAGLPIADARRAIKEKLAESGFLTERKPTEQTVSTHERCDTPIEYLLTNQWFVRVLDQKERLLAAGEKIDWYPAHMQARYRQWVENLGWDWCISRQRFFGVTFPVWYCTACGEPHFAQQNALPVDPTEMTPEATCTCGNGEFSAETDVMDTWATSSMTPTIAQSLVAIDKPMWLRPQAHEIIRTWAFYTIVKSLYHDDELPWSTITLSGWGLAPEGTAKISKSRGGGPLSPSEMIEKYSADAVRYWAASTGFGRDSRISEDKIKAGQKLVTKLWNVARFGGQFLGDGALIAPTNLSLADRWLLSRLNQLIRRATDLFERYDYATAKAEIEQFFWTELADNYLEMAKQRLYSEPEDGQGARFTLQTVILATTKLFAPFLPFVTERIYQGLFAQTESASIHNRPWPKPDPQFDDATAIAAGQSLVAIASAVRGYKTTNELSLGSELACLQIATTDEALSMRLPNGFGDLTSITRAKSIKLVDQTDANLIDIGSGILVGIEA